MLSGTLRRRTGPGRMVSGILGLLYLQLGWPIRHLLGWPLSMLRSIVAAGADRQPKICHAEPGNSALHLFLPPLTLITTSSLLIRPGSCLPFASVSLPVSKFTSLTGVLPRVATHTDNTNITVVSAASPISGHLRRRASFSPLPPLPVHWPFFTDPPRTCDRQREQ